jgi:hypothetical protein
VDPSIRWRIRTLRPLRSLTYGSSARCGSSPDTKLD